MDHPDLTFPELAFGEDHIDVTVFGVRMGIVMRIGVEQSTFRKHFAKAKNPDRDVFVALDAACESMESSTELTFPFHYTSRIKGSTPERVRLYMSMVQEDDKPWLMVSSTPLS
jgi:hypothetical protein